jgi:hypothetical protein
VGTKYQGSLAAGRMGVLVMAIASAAEVHTLEGLRLSHRRGAAPSAAARELQRLPGPGGGALGPGGGTRAQPLRDWHELTAR